MSTPYPNPEQEEPTDRGKYFAPTDANYAVTAYIDIIDKATGQSVTGYPQIVNTSAAYSNFGINSGGYIRLKGWKVTTSGNHLKVSVTTTRWNTTYSNPIDDTYATQNDVDDWCSAYATGPYAIYDDLAKGTCGDNATWVLYKSGQLVISGTGALWAKSQITWDSTKVVDVLVGEGITSLSTELFRGYTNIRDVHLPSTLTALGTGAFRGSSLRSINIPESVRTIPSYCFSGCQLPKIVLPSTITAINAYGLNASALRSVTILATTPPDGGGQSSTTAFSTASTIYVPAASLNAYKTSRWSKYADQFQPIPSGD